MTLVAIFAGIVLIVAAFRNSQGALFTALSQDVPPFVVWGAALLAIGAIGFVPGLRPVSRGLLALVITVLILNNWPKIQAGFVAAAGDTSQAATDKAAGVTPVSSSGAGSSPSSLLLSISDAATSAADIAGSLGAA
jgi:hypothetical protein